MSKREKTVVDEERVGKKNKQIKQTGRISGGKKKKKNLFIIIHPVLRSSEQQVTHGC